MKARFSPLFPANILSRSRTPLSPRLPLVSAYRSIHSFVRGDYPWSVSPQPWTHEAAPAPHDRHTFRKRLFERFFGKMAPYRLLVLENPLLDIQAVGDDKLLNKYGLKANDAILAEEKHLGIYADLESRDAKLIAGGAAQNTARGAQYILSPSSVVYLGAVGKDSYADTLDSACKQAGLATEYLRLDSHPTGRCGVVITGHDRSMCTDLAAANHYTLDHLKQPQIWSHAQKAEMFYVGGYHLTVSPPAAMALGEEAASTGKPFAFGMGAPFIPSFFAEPLGKLFPYCDYIFCNETEAGAWAEKQENISDKSIPGIAKAMAAVPKKNTKRARTVIISQGTDPTVIAIGGESKTHEFPVHAIDPKEINDTNGAGDAFAGGFLAGLVDGKDLKTCVDMGQWLAALGLRELGPSYIPYAKANIQVDVMRRTVSRLSTLPHELLEVSPQGAPGIQQEPAKGLKGFARREMRRQAQFNIRGMVLRNGPEEWS
ncbi:MAG: adenosine kinase [Chrysothrix sp. TS-e1954]|nr:MAG: adenosine kinase [Chrysothrix sp. TS-e1954]